MQPYKKDGIRTSRRMTNWRASDAKTAFFLLFKQAKTAGNPRRFLLTGLVVVIAAVFVVAAGGGEFLGGEGDTAEHFTGVFPGAGVVAAFLAGDGVIQHRHHQLGIPFQPDNGELAQGHEQLPLASGEYQGVFVQFPDAVGDLDGDGFTAAGIRFLHPGGQHHGIQYLHCGHQFDRQ